MQDTALLDAVERYIHGDMLPEEKAFFEQLRQSRPEVDQLVVEHTLFLQQLNKYGEVNQLKSQLRDIHQQLTTDGQIDKTRPVVVVTLWKKYRRVVGVAASIAGITALCISGLISYLSPKVSQDKMIEFKRILEAQNSRIDQLQKGQNRNAIPSVDFKSGGTGFLIDGKGYLVTNAHVVDHATVIDVQNSQGEYKARILHVDPTTDLALLKIEDSTFTPISQLPYGISKSRTRLGEDQFTMGFPRNEIVYNKGYVSARTGFKGDTTAYQITLAAYPGNSGSPVFNKDGEVVGIVKGAAPDAQMSVFAVRSKNIYRVIDDIKADSNFLKTDSDFVRLHVPATSQIKGQDRIDQQIPKIEDCIFIVKSNQ